MDSTDRKILAELQQDGKLTAAELAARTGLSLSRCQRHVRALETERTIVGYHAIIESAAIGLNFSAIVFATLSESGVTQVQSFEDAIVDIPEIIQAERLFGKPDYMLYVVTRDLTTFQSLYERNLLRLPCVLKLTSTVVIKNIVRNRPLPL